MSFSDHIFEKYAIVCKVIDACGTLSGRKKFHKIMYICKESNYPIHETFKWATYGVYSSELSGEIESLQSSGFVNEIQSKNSSYTTYDYTISDDGKVFLDKMKEDLLQNCDGELSDRFLSLVKRLNQCSSRDLELFSSIMFLSKDDEEQEDLISFLEYLKPKYLRNEIVEGIAAVGKLKSEFDIT
ncbi:MAG: hypothetical protein U9N12_04290 [Euryarchaeota archaeon]|nr:hypothetical protein [Euryarchaeota archaeon]